jgi:predicted ribosomally synthesized peptide with SipW-like signal peptide
MIDNNQNNNDNNVNEKAVNEQVNDQVNKVEQVEDRKEKGKGAFYGIIAFAIFIIMAVGATFAYFTATTSSADNSVNAGSTNFSLDYISYTTAWSKNKLIPVATNVVEYSVEQRPDATHEICVDDNNREICSLHEFQIQNSSDDDQTVSIKLGTNTNSFENLRAMIYKISPNSSNYDATTAVANDPVFAVDETEYSDGNHVQVQDAAGEALYEFTPVYVNRLGVDKVLQNVNGVDSVAVEVPALGEDPVTLADGIVLPGVNSQNYGYQTFLVVLYILNLDENQNSSDGAKTFSGRIIVEGSDGSARISGAISTADDSVLQHQDATTEETTP